MKYTKAGRRLQVDIPLDHPFAYDLKSRGFKWDNETLIFWKGFTKAGEAWLKEQKAARLTDRLAALLRCAMEQRDITSPALSRATGINVRSIQRWRRGEHLKLEALEKVCAALGFDIEITLTPRTIPNSAPEPDLPHHLPKEIVRKANLWRTRAEYAR